MRTLEGLPRSRDLGVMYLVSVGFIFTVMVFQAAFGLASPTLGQLLSLSAGFVLAVGLIVVGYWLSQSTLGDEQVVLVSQLGALGMAIPTLVIVIGVFFLPLEPTSGLLVTVIGAGGVVGTLFGSVRGLESEHEELNELYSRNRVLHRVLRHNIRNGMTVIQGYADLLEDDVSGKRRTMVRHIHQEASSIVDLSEMARNLDSLETDQHRHPIDIVTVTEELIESLQRNYPNVDIQTEMPGSAPVQADNFIELALWELLEYAIRHSDTAPVEVSVTVAEDGAVTTTIRDNEPGLSEAGIRALERGTENQMQHLDSMELWVAKWLVENMDGFIRFESLEPTGTAISVELPPAEGPVETAPRSLESNASSR